ncbi:Fe-S cluster assembly protein SufD [Marinicauda salina]|uniref:Fe-S cluster assembly protein SufD n=1 Tax=Marinicauda salina TaxID=2135793 RepID=A0A2U2BTF3_9PROT|nr:SufD family Fe-S cluster assembly protein [Marinicauda salina]PWE17293.1 Fe-S cluster assembly protein SufD [Marinicauda salina]
MTAAIKTIPLEDVFLAELPEAGEDWRALLRADLAERGLPHRRVEEWKWSDLRAALARMGGDAGSIAVDASRAPDETAPVAQAPTLVMPRLAAALGGPADIYRLTDGEALNLDISAKPGAAHKVIAIELPAGVEASLHERYAGAAGAFANVAVLIRLGEGARLTRLIEQDASSDAVMVVTSGIELSANARATQTTLGFGAKLARLETHVTHPGEGADLSLDGAYIVGDKLHLDQTTFVRHTGEGGTTSELFKGAAAKGGRGVFQGKIFVERAAQKTDARMTHRGLLLDEGAEIDAKPELEIYADDVECAHGNALGAIDETALFYMRQRGIPEPQARALLTESFLAEPLMAIADEAERERLLEKLRARLKEVA